MVPTLTQRLLAEIRLIPGRSAWELAQAVRHDKNSVGSILLRLVKRGRLRRVPGEGLRGGYGYYHRSV